MRRAILGLVMIGLVHDASAGDLDLPVLRGSNAYDMGMPAYHRWSGFYVGGQGGFTAANLNFSKAGQSLLADMLRNTTIESEFAVSHWPQPTEGRDSGLTYGGFIGYNWQWDDAVLGLELNYNRSSFSSSGSDSITRIITTLDEYQYTVTATASGSAKVTDFGTFRVRGGYVMGSFMPYGTVGLAVGLVNLTKTASVSYPAPIDVSSGGVQPLLPPFSDSASLVKNGVVAVGYSAGLGFDYEVVPGVFVRGEYEYVGFPSVKDFSINISTVRGGVGVKF
jgi:opacity protein-like surface antigen